MPVTTEVHLTLDVDKHHIAAMGVVRTYHPAMGNGVEFTQLAPDHMQRLEQLLASLATPYDPAPAAISSKSPNGVAGVISSSESTRLLEAQMEALLKLLEQKAILNRDELLQLRKNALGQLA